MKNENGFSESGQNKKAEDFQYECQYWKSKLCFMEDETIFIDRLLNSNVFEIETPNLFERLQDYKRKLKEIETKKIEVIQRITEYERIIDIMHKGKNDAPEIKFYLTYNDLRRLFIGFEETFQSLKVDIFNYVGGILQKRDTKTKQ